MTTRSAADHATHRRTRRAPALTAATAAPLVAALLVVVQAQQPVRTGEELYLDRLGCWNCHGQTGTGGAGPSILKSQLPLRRFVKSVRLPSQTMPRFSPALASDADLATVYRWLDGAEPVAAPPPIVYSLEAAPEAKEDGPAPGGKNVLVTVRLNDAGTNGPAPGALRHRIALAQATAAVANETVGYHVGAGDDWKTVTTDEQGEATLAPGALAFDAPESEAKAATARLRMTLPPGRYALVLEAIDEAAPAGAVVLGVGSAVFTVE